MNSRPPCTPRLLWFDLTHDRSAADCIAVFADRCRITQAKDLSLSGLGAEQRPDMICMHYDRPDTLGLGLLMEVKRMAPSIPITMLTVHHSEELAVWAFRSGVWEFLVLPLLNAERDRYLKALLALCQMRSNPTGNGSKQLLTRENLLPESIRLTQQHQQQQPLQQAMRYIEQHYSEHLEQKVLAERCGMTPFRFSRLFKQACGMSFPEYVQRKRLEKAEELLANSQMPITSIAYAVGFQDPSYFARAFKQQFGCCPSDFRRSEPLPGQGDEPLTPQHSLSF
ncbi:response regulator transcription factor [Pseudomonas sp. SP16.1]|uniref:response regulator transcription factor n=1 Tax=Pseudomonas sp. SP16.1 TaxID=3458854 RepID=UPI004046838F